MMKGRQSMSQQIGFPPFFFFKPRAAWSFTAVEA